MFISMLVYIHVHVHYMFISMLFLLDELYVMKYI